jgi:hypothetical protein
MKKQGILFIAITLLIPFLGYGNESDVVENVSRGSINWTSGIVTAVGIGAPPEKFLGKPQARPMALRAAKIDAMRNLLEITKGVRIDSRTEVKDFAVENDTIVAEVSGIVNDARIVKQEYMSDGTAEITMQMEMNGGFSNIILPAAEAFKASSDTRPDNSNSVYTGLIIDAKGLGLRPAMAPKILNENGQEIYGTGTVSREHAVRQGITGYAKNIENAKKNQRVTDNPIIFKGLRIEGSGRCDVVISNQDASKLKAGSLSFLKECRVMFVAD